MTNGPVESGGTQPGWTPTTFVFVAKGGIVDWPTAAVLIAVVFALMVVLATYISVRFAKK